MGSTNAGYFFTNTCTEPPASVGNACISHVACDMPAGSGNGRCGPWMTWDGGDQIMNRAKAEKVANFTDAQVARALDKIPYDARIGAGANGWLHDHGITSNEFRGYWEHLHDEMHGWVGGDLNSIPGAPEDPSFWLAHAYFDCMWVAWEGLHGTHVPAFRDKDCYRPDKAKYPADAPTPPGNDADDKMGPWYEKTIREVLSVQALGYNYDTQHQTCGNNLREGSEQCDGTDAAACPGQCLGNCTCPKEGGAVPAVSEWGLIVLTLLVLCAGTIMFSRHCAA